VVLTNGQVRAGEFIKITPQTLTLKTGSGTIDIPRTEIEELQSAGSPAPGTSGQPAGELSTAPPRSPSQRTPAMAKPASPPPQVAASNSAPPAAAADSRAPREGLILRQGALALHDSRGEVIWSYRPQNQERILSFVHVPMRGRDDIAVCCKDAVLLLDGQTGREIWRQANRGQPLASIEHAAGSQWVKAIDLERGEHLYEAATGRFVRSIAAAPRSSAGAARSPADAPQSGHFLDSEGFQRVMREAARAEAEQSEGGQSQNAGPSQLDAGSDRDVLTGRLFRLAERQNGRVTDDLAGVVSASVELKVGKTVVGTVARGDILLVLKQENGWLWVETLDDPPVKGWIQMQHCIKPNGDRFDGF